MRTLIIALVAIGLIIFVYPANTVSQSFKDQTVPYNSQNAASGDQASVYNNSEYTLRVNIGNKWYLITYSSDGYIINIVEDDE